MVPERVSEQEATALRQHSRESDHACVRQAQGGSKMRPEIDESLCIGDAICADICPEVFEMRDNDLAHVIDENPSPDLHEKVKEAADACPTSAILIHEV